jgi:predicted CopG family antitoxin
MITITEDEYDELLQEKAFREGCEAIIGKLLERTKEINNACFDYQNMMVQPTLQDAWNTIKKIYNLSLMPQPSPTDEL